jgi:hypothetical protein
MDGSTSAYVGACRKDIPYPSVSHESVPSLIDNLVSALYGSITKTVVNRRVVWNIPCDPNNTANINNIPRNAGEGLLCYIIRALNLTGASGFVTANGVQTLTNKTLTAPVINGGTINNLTATGTLALPAGSITSTMIANGSISDIDVASTAAIATSKLAPVTATGSTTSRSLPDRFADVVNVKDFGAVGDGVTDDTAAFTSLESSNNGLSINLGGGTFVVTAIPNRNFYYNGFFKCNGIRTAAFLSNNYPYFPPKFHTFGNQLKSLAASLANPLEQQTTIAFVGDSITWGKTLAENQNASYSRNGTLKDWRDAHTSPSFVNLFKNYIGNNFFSNTDPTISNWQYSSGGESTSTYTRTERLFTATPPFAASTGTASTTDLIRLASGCILGTQHVISLGASGTNRSFTFPFTGTTFTIVFSSTVQNQTCNYNVLVNGQSIGTFTPWTSLNVYQQRITHTFGFVKNATITIQCVWNSSYSAGTQSMYLEALEIPKTCTIINQGISGATSYSYYHYNTNSTTTLAGNGTTGQTFAIPFPFLSGSVISAQWKTSSGSITNLVYGTDFSITGGTGTDTSLTPPTTSMEGGILTLLGSRTIPSGDSIIITRSYYPSVPTGGSYANTSDIGYVFLQIGTNDRTGSYPTYNQSNGISTLTLYLKYLIDCFASSKTILMVSNPPLDNSSPTYFVDQQDIRNVILNAANANSLDFIDNYSMFRNANTLDFTADGLHPNTLGHALIAQNIINSFESA